MSSLANNPLTKSKRAVSFSNLSSDNLKGSQSNLAAASKGNLSQSRNALGSTNLLKSSSNKLNASNSNLRNSSPQVLRKSLHNLMLDVEEKLKLAENNFEESRKSEESLERLSNESLNNEKLDVNQGQRLHLTSLADLADNSIDNVNILAPPKKPVKKEKPVEEVRDPGIVLLNFFTHLC